MKIDFSVCNKCRICDSRVSGTLLDFKEMPFLAEPIKPGSSVPAGPLTVLVCADCGYVFLKEVINCSIYNDYIYTPQASDDVVAYLRDFVSNVKEKRNLKQGQCGLEIGSGDGSLCREFNNAGIRFIGVEPSKVLSRISEQQNKVETHNTFMSLEVANRFGYAFDLVVVRHVLEHINEFAPFFEAINKCLKPGGSLVVEVPYLGEIVSQKQFYSFFFEHLSYFSVNSLANLFKKYGFFIDHCEFVYPEGGSVLVYATRDYSPSPSEQSNFDESGLIGLRDAFAFFRQRFEDMIGNFGPIAAYGAGQRGITLLNLLGASDANVVAIFDENPVYHGLRSPMSGVPVRPPVEMNKKNIKGKVLILASSYDKQIRDKYKQMSDRFVSLAEIV